MRYTAMEAEERTCLIERGSNGFGFILCCENDTTDTYVLHVLNASPAGKVGLRPGDRIIEVNGVNVEKEEHKSVVEKLQGMQSIRLVVAHNSSVEEYFKKPANGMTVKPLEDGTPVLRPKLITVKRNERGFDFSLQTVGKSRRNGSERHRLQLKGISGHYASNVRPEGIAYRTGLREGHRIIEINGVDIEKESHAYVIAAIKSSKSVELLIVDRETDEFFKRHGVSPSSKHLTGELEFKNTIPNKKIINNNYDSPIYKSHEELRPNNKLSPQTVSPTRTNQTSQLQRAKAPVLAMSTPNLTSVGLERPMLLYDESTCSGSGTEDKANRKQRIAKAKKEIKKKLSRHEKKSTKPKLLYNKVTVPGSRTLYDDTVISDDGETSSLSTSYSKASSQSYRRLDDLSINDQYLPYSRVSQSVSDLSRVKMSPCLSSKSSTSDDQQVLLTFERSDCDSPTSGYESPEELSSVGFNVDLKTLKERVRKQSNRSKSELVRSKSKLSDYSLAHMYVNSY